MSPKTQYESLKENACKLYEKRTRLFTHYFSSLVPITSWISRYNSKWLFGDAIAGLTVGIVVLPQAIAYATKLSNLPAQFGLYSSFAGVLLYPIFGTSKETTIGPSSIICLLLGQLIAKYHIGQGLDETDAIFAKVAFTITLTFVTGLCQILFGLLRFGVLVDMIPVPVIAGFTTGAGLQILAGQLPHFLGISGISTTNPTFQIFADCIQRADTARFYDSVFGISSLSLILLMKYNSTIFRCNTLFTKYLAILKYVVTLIVFTSLSYFFNPIVKDSLSIVGYIPSGLKGLPTIPTLENISLLDHIFQSVPAILTLSILQHVAVTKSFGMHTVKHSLFKSF
jgi:solute carrier family 26 (sodium-independent sulfate anion transporter), member 11